MRTYWAAKTGEPGEWIEIDLGAMKHIKAIQLNYYDHKVCSIIVQTIYTINIVSTPVITGQTGH